MNAIAAALKRRGWEIGGRTGDVDTAAGSVFRATHLSSRKRAVVKVQPANDEFDTETRVLKKLKAHRAKTGERFAPDVLASGKVGRVGYIVMDDVANYGAIPVSQMLAPGKSPSYLMTVLTSVILKTVRLHALGVVHGDMHGGNVYYDRANGATFIDFGRSVAPKKTAPKPRMNLDTLTVDFPVTRPWNNDATSRQLGMPVQTLYMNGNRPITSDYEQIRRLVEFARVHLIGASSVTLRTDMLSAPDLSQSDRAVLMYAMFADTPLDDPGLKRAAVLSPSLAAFLGERRRLGRQYGRVEATRRLVEVFAQGRCTATTKSGARCRRKAGPSGKCAQHSR